MTYESVKKEITVLQEILKRHQEGVVGALPEGMVYRDAIIRLKYLKNRFNQLHKKNVIKKVP